MAVCPRRLALVGLLALLASTTMSLPASAATVTERPDNTWSVYKSCGPKSSKANCAAVYAIAAAGSTVYIGGEFTHLVSRSGNLRPAHNLAALDASTGSYVNTFRLHAINGRVNALATSGSRLYVGGAFTRVDGERAGHLATFSLSGSRLPSAANTSGVVRALLAGGSSLYAGGDFSSPRDHVAKFDLGSGVLEPGFSPSFHSFDSTSVHALALSPVGDRLYVGGHFDKVGGQLHRAIAAVSPGSGAVLGSFNPKVESFRDNDVLLLGSDIVATPNGILLGQQGHSNRAYRFDLAGRKIWQVHPDGDVQTLALNGDSVYVGGHFVCGAHCDTNPLRRIHVMAVHYGSGQVDSTWHPALGPTSSPYFFGVWVLRMVGSSLWAGGVFNEVTVHRQTYRQPKLAVFR